MADEAAKKDQKSTEVLQDKGDGVAAPSEKKDDVADRLNDIDPEDRNPFVYIPPMNRGDTPFVEGLERAERRLEAQHDVEVNGPWDVMESLGKSVQTPHPDSSAPEDVITWNYSSQVSKKIVHPPRFQIVAEIPELHETVTLEWDGTRFHTNNETLVAHMGDKEEIELLAKIGRNMVQRGVEARAYQQTVGADRPLLNYWERKEEERAYRESRQR